TMFERRRYGPCRYTSIVDVCSMLKISAVFSSTVARWSCIRRAIAGMMRGYRGDAERAPALRRRLLRVVLDEREQRRHAGRVVGGASEAAAPPTAASSRARPTPVSATRARRRDTPPQSTGGRASARTAPTSSAAVDMRCATRDRQAAQAVGARLRIVQPSRGCQLRDVGERDADARLARLKRLDGAHRSTAFGDIGRLR